MIHCFVGCPPTQAPADDINWIQLIVLFKGRRHEIGNEKQREFGRSGRRELGLNMSRYSIHMKL